MEKFVDIFSKKYNLNSKDAASLLALMEPVTYRRGEMLVREGELNTSFHLIGQGIWRGYYLRNGVDVSIWFATTGESLFSTRGYMGGRPSGTSIEAMSDSLLYRIGRQELEAFFHSSAAAATWDGGCSNESFWCSRNGSSTKEPRRPRSATYHCSNACPSCCNTYR